MSLKVQSSVRLTYNSWLPKNIALTKYNFIRLEWVLTSIKNEPSLTQDDTPVMITTSAHITRQLLPVSLSAAFLPAHWVYQYPGLKTLSETSINKPLYAVWLQKMISKLLSIN